MASNKAKMKARIKQDAKAGKAKREQGKNHQNARASGSGARQREKWNGMTPEEQAALQQSDPFKANGMRYGKFAGYDVASNGGKGFDGKDLKHLQQQGWNNNDILQAAASSNYVNGRADRLLGMLNRPLDPGNSKDRKILQQGKDALGTAGWYTGMNGGDIRFLGGDPSKKKNWLLGDPTAEHGTNRADWEVTGGGFGGVVAHERNRNSKVGGPVYEWGGRNADGTANALGGFDYKFNADDQAMVRTASWAMPRGMANQRFSERIEAAGGSTKPADDGSESGSDSSVDDAAPPLQSYDGATVGADYGVKPYGINTDTSIFDAFADAIGNGKRFAASEAVKQRLGFA